MTRLEKMIDAARRDPLAPRRELFSALLHDPVYALALDDGGGDGERRHHAPCDLELWMDSDEATGALWVPLFTSPERVAEFVEVSGVEAPAGRSFKWFERPKGALFPLFQSQPLLAGAVVDRGRREGVRLEWPELEALSDQRIPDDAPVLYPLELEPLKTPEEARCLFGKDSGRRQVVFPDAGDIAVEEFRRLAGLEIDGEGPVWTPCRHLASALRGFARRDGGLEYRRVLAKALLAFDFLGDAEALCADLKLIPGQEAFATATLAAVLRRWGRLDDCVAVCAEGLRRFPKERSLYVDEAFAFAQLEDLEAARETARRGAELFPDEQELRRFLK